MVDQCHGTTRGGKPCAAKPRPGTELCPWHTPALAEQRREWSKKGGAGRSNRARMAKQIGTDALTLDEMRGLRSVAMRDVLGGKLEPSVVNAAANVARSLNDLIKTHEHEARLAQLEVAANIERRQAWRG